MPPILRIILVLIAAITLPSFAVPTTGSQVSVHTEGCGLSSSGHKTYFRRIRDSIIESIWDVPKKPCHLSNVKHDHTVPAKFQTKYGRSVVLRFKISTKSEAEAFFDAADTLYLDVWDHSSQHVDVRVPKDMLPSFFSLLPTSLQDAHTPLMRDLAQAVHDSYPSPARSDSRRHFDNRPAKEYSHDLFFEDYRPLSVLYPWMKMMAELYPHHAQHFSIGKSAEGRDIPAFRVSAAIQDQNPDDGVDARQTILIVGGSHAREWISVSTVAYLIFDFVTRNGKSHSPIVTKILKHYDIVFIPVLNPDGYEYTWSTDRLWRKNRQATTLPFCPGIDLDRAFGFEWNGEHEADNPCAESYAGEHAWQAVEAKVLADWVYNQTRDNNAVFSTYLDFHSYSQKVLYPFSYSCASMPANLEDLEEAAIGLAKSIRLSTGEFYEVTSACDSQLEFTHQREGKKAGSRTAGPYGSGGSSLDYFYEVLRVRWAYQIKLRDTGTYGFLLPKDNIIPSGQEAFAAVVGLGRYLLSNRGIELTEVEEDVGLPAPVKSDVSQAEWQSRQPAYLFHPSASQAEKTEADTDNDDDERERIFDAELRRRR